MRLQNVLVALGSVAGIIGTVQGGNIRRGKDFVENNTLDRRGVTAGAVKASPVDSSPNANVIAPPKAGTNGLAKKKPLSGNPVKVSNGASSAQKSGDKKPALSCPAKTPPKGLKGQKNAVGKRTLEQSPKQVQNGVVELDENEYILSNQLQSGDTVRVINLSGCTAVILWDDYDMPSVFHIYCGSETDDAAEAYRKVYGAGLWGFTHTTIAAAEPAYRDNAATALQQCAGTYRLPIVEPFPYQLKDATRVYGKMGRVMLTIKAGDPTRNVEKTEYKGGRKQAAQPNPLYGQGGGGSSQQDPYDTYRTGQSSGSAPQGSQGGYDSYGQYSGGRQYHQGGQ